MNYEKKTSYRLSAPFALEWWALAASVLVVMLYGKFLWVYLTDMKPHLTDGSGMAGMTIYILAIAVLVVAAYPVGMIVRALFGYFRGRRWDPCADGFSNSVLKYIDRLDNQYGDRRVAVYVICWTVLISAAVFLLHGIVVIKLLWAVVLMVMVGVILFLRDDRAIADIVTALFIQMGAISVLYIIRDRKALFWDGSIWWPVWIVTTGLVVLVAVVTHRRARERAKLRGTIAVSLMSVFMVACFITYPLINGLNCYLDRSEGYTVAGMVIDETMQAPRVTVLLEGPYVLARFPFRGERKEEYIRIHRSQAELFSPRDSIAIRIHEGFFGLPWVGYAENGHGVMVYNGRL